MNELFCKYCNFVIKEQYIAKYGSKNIGGCLLEEVDVQSKTIKINRYANAENVNLEEFCRENSSTGGSMFLLVYNSIINEVNEVKKISSSKTADFYMKMSRVLDSVSGESITDYEGFMLEFLGEDYEVPQTLKRIYMEETESKYSKIGYYKEIVKRLGKGYDGKGLYVVDNIIDYSSHEPFMDIVLWTVGLFRKLKVSGIANTNAYKELAKSSYRKIICYRDDDGAEVVATPAEQKKLSSRCYTKSIRILDIEKIAQLHIVAWLMTGDELMYKGSFLESTNMKFAREWSDTKVSVEEFCYRLKLSHNKIMDALQYMSSTSFVEEDAKKLIEAVGKRDSDFLDSSYAEYTDVNSDGEQEVSMKDIVKAVAQIEPLNDYEDMAKKIAQHAYKTKRFVLSEKQRKIVIGVYNSCHVDKGELSDEVVEAIEFIKKYNGKNIKEVVRNIIKSIERYGKCSEKQLGVLQREVESIKDELDGGIKKKKTIKKDADDDGVIRKPRNNQMSMLGEEGAANIFGISFDIQKEK